jgi:organic radical activating enzyme
MDGSGGGRFAAAHGLARSIRDAWLGDHSVRPLAVLTGGEPLLQVDVALVDALHELGIEIAVETNGTLAPPAGIDWICVSGWAPLALDREQGEARLPATRRRTNIQMLAFDHFCYNRWTAKGKRGRRRGLYLNPRWRRACKPTAQTS